MKYCSQCGQAVVLKVPPEDKLPRFVCESCGTIHYQNPRMVVGCVPEWEGSILLCRRAIEPRLGYWTLPAGFMENHETVEACARREAEEEALAVVELGSLISLINVPHASQVHLFFRARLVDGRFGVGHESQAAALYGETDIPWSDLAFPSVEFTLQRYFADRAQGREETYVTTLERMRRESR
jgi:ADP-ribose pyrophosphatase YjhB (NUDIX family)